MCDENQAETYLLRMTTRVLSPGPEAAPLAIGHRAYPGVLEWARLWLRLVKPFLHQYVGLQLHV